MFSYNFSRIAHNFKKRFLSNQIHETKENKFKVGIRFVSHTLYTKRIMKNIIYVSEVYKYLIILKKPKNVSSYYSEISVVRLKQVI